MKRIAAVVFALFGCSAVAWGAFNELPPGVVIQANLGTNVFAYLANAADSATGFVSGNALGAGTQAALAGPLNGVGGLQTSLMEDPSVQAAGQNAVNNASGLVQLTASGLLPSPVVDTTVSTAVQNPVNGASGLVQLGTSGGIGTNIQAALSVATNAASGLLQLNGSGLIPSPIMSASVSAAIPNAVNGASGLLQLNGSGVVPQANLTTPAGTASTVASSTAPASTTVFAMQGLAGTITPATSGRVKITISGTIIAPTGITVNNGIAYQISTGTGTAPINAATLTGTQVGPVQTYTSAVAPTAAADVHVPFSISYLVSGLTVGTPVWIDLAAKSVTTVSAMALSAVSIVAVEF